MRIGGILISAPYVGFDAVRLMGNRRKKPSASKSQGKVRLHEKGYNLHGNPWEPGLFQDRVMPIPPYSNTHSDKTELIALAVLVL